MMRAVILALGAATALGATVLTASNEASAEPPKPPASCPEGRLASGDCINPAMAASLRQNSVMMAQPKFSYSAPPRLPSRDGVISEPRNPAEILSLFFTTAINW